MKLATTNAPIEIQGGGTESKFSIAMNAKAFRVLSDTLYQNKIGSIVREISCNALDAHAMSKKMDVPFVIHLPDAFEPFFSVKDFGVGLTPDDISSVFTVYFASTKDQNNDAIGAFGLGAKTPFSYTDQFTVNSITGGVKRTYSAYITESGLPTIVEMASAKTTECNGVEIIMSVKKDDYNTFAEEVRDQLRFFTVKPVIQNRSSFQFHNEPTADDVFLSNADFRLYNSGSVSHYRDFHAVQGNVGYEVDIQLLRGKLTQPSREVLSAIQNRADLLFNIGELGVTASREGIEYTDHTIAMFEAKLSRIGAVLQKFVNDKISTLPTDWQRIQFLNGNGDLLKLIGSSGVSATKSVRIGQNYGFNISTLLEPKKFGWSNWIPNRTTRENYSNQNFVPVLGKKIGIVLRDTANRPNMKAKFWRDSQSYDVVHEISTDDVLKFDDAFVASLTDALGGFTDIVRLSTIVLPERVSTATGTTQRVSYTRPTHYVTEGYDCNVRVWEKSFDGLESLTDTTVYMIMSDMMVNGSHVEKFKHLSKLGDVPELIAIRESDLKKVANSANFISINDYLSLEIAKLMNDKALKTAHRKAIVLENIKAHLNIGVNLGGAFDDMLAVVDKRNQLVRLLSITRQSTQELNFREISALTGWKHDTVASIRAQKCKTILNKLYVRYPLAKVYNEWNVNRSISTEHLALYIKNM